MTFVTDFISCKLSKHEESIWRSLEKTNIILKHSSDIGPEEIVPQISENLKHELQTDEMHIFSIDTASWVIWLENFTDERVVALNPSSLLACFQKYLLKPWFLTSKQTILLKKTFNYKQPEKITCKITYAAVILSSSLWLVRPLLLRHGCFSLHTGESWNILERNMRY